MATPSSLFDPDEIALAPHPDEGVDPQQPAPPAVAVLGAGPADWRDFPTEGAPPFINTRLTVDEWAAYAAAYQFGGLTPSRLVLHHTYRPDQAQWAGLTSMRGMQHFYAGKGWTSAPHIYVAPDGIWLATPLSRIGIHAGAGNGSVREGWYSIGLEMVGDFDGTRPSGTVWAYALAVMVGLARRLGREIGSLLSFHRDYMEKSCPGWAVTREWVLAEVRQAMAPAARAYRVRLHVPVFEAPPGAGTPLQVAWRGRAVLTPGQEVNLTKSVLAGWLHWSPGGFVEAAAVEFLPTTTTARYTADSPIMAVVDRAGEAAFVAACVARCRAAHTPYTDHDLRSIFIAYWARSRAVGVDPYVAAAQCLHETGNLTSFWSLRPQRNPAGIGVTGQWAATAPDGDDGAHWTYNHQRRRWEIGLMFASWAEHAIPAHVGRLLAYALPPQARTPIQHLQVTDALRYRDLPVACHGSARTLAELGAGPNPVAGCGWAGAGNTEGEGYGAGIASIAQALWKLGTEPEDL